MKFLSFVLALLLSAAPVFAHPRRTVNLPANAVRRTILQERIQAPQKVTAREQALQQLAARQDPKNWKRISWKEYKKANENAKKREG
ncbi:MAG: hypothetical protein Q4P84_07295, partial [Elusimicrobiales bacterium]|nr:hypothetical protein [Elusimicrobiales bacterium]